MSISSSAYASSSAGEQRCRVATIVNYSSNCTDGYVTAVIPSTEVREIFKGG
jgi:hypothetical protein